MTRYLPFVADVVGLLLLLAGAIGIAAVAFACDERGGWAVVSAYAIGAGWRLSSQGEG